MNRHSTTTLVVLGVLMFALNVASYFATLKYISPVIDNYMNNLVEPYRKATEQQTREPIPSSGVRSKDPSTLDVEVWNSSMSSPYGQDADDNTIYSEVPLPNEEYVY